MDTEEIVKFSWSVQRFDTFPIIPGTSLLSETFYADSSKAAEFCLRIEAGPFPSTSNACVGSLFLCRCDNDGPETVEVKYEIFFPISGQVSKNTIFFSKPKHNHLRYEHETNVLNITKGDMSAEELLVICRILLYADGRYQKSDVGNLGDLENLSKDFRTLFETSLFSDAVIRIQNREFNVHRAIVDARCPGLLEECQANQSGEAVIQYDEHIIEKLLYYIYTGKFECENIPDDLCFLLKKCSDSHFKHLCLSFFNEMHAHTFFTCYQISWDWTIENFFNFSEDMEFSRKIIDNDPSTWFKMTFFTVQHKSDLKHLKFVMRKMCEETVRFVRCTISVEDSAGERTLIFYGSHLFKDEHPMQVTLDDKVGLIRSKMYLEAVTFNVEIDFTDGVPVNSIQNVKKSSEVNAPQYIHKVYELGCDIGRLCGNSEHSDVILKIKDSRISAHRAILSARSHLFRRIFQQNTYEGEHAEVDINDLDENVALSMIRYIYSADVINTDGYLAIQLYKAAKLYKIPQLQEIFSMHM